MRSHNHAFDNKKYYAENKEKIAVKKGGLEELIREVMLTEQHEATKVTSRLYASN